MTTAKDTVPVAVSSDRDKNKYNGIDGHGDYTRSHFKGSTTSRCVSVGWTSSSH